MGCLFAALLIGCNVLLGRPGGDLLSRVLGRSTIGAEGFHGRVRDGIGCIAPRNDHQVVEAEDLNDARACARAVLDRYPVSRDRVNEVASCAGDRCATLAPLVRSGEGPSIVQGDPFIAACDG